MNLTTTKNKSTYSLYMVGLIWLVEITLSIFNLSVLKLPLILLLNLTMIIFVVFSFKGWEHRLSKTASTTIGFILIAQIALIIIEFFKQEQDFDYFHLSGLILFLANIYLIYKSKGSKYLQLTNLGIHLTYHSVVYSL